MNRFVDNTFIFAGGIVVGGVIGCIGTAVGVLAVTSELMEKHILLFDFKTILFGDEPERRKKKKFYKEAWR